MIGPNVRHAAELDGLVQDVRNAMVSDGSSFEVNTNVEIKKDPEAVRRERVRQLYETRLVHERIKTGVLLFYAWLEKRYPHLLPAGPGGLSERLNVDLSGLFQ